MLLSAKQPERGEMKNFRKWFVLVPAVIIWLWGSAFAETEGTSRTAIPPGGLAETVKILASFEDRSTGTRGAERAASYIKKRFAEMGFEEVGSHFFKTPIRKHGGSTLFISEKGSSVPIQPISSNLISPETIPKEGMEGPLVFVGAGELKDFNGKDIAGSIILMDLESGKNWLHAASLGAKALIYLDRGPTSRVFFEEKIEMTPIQFPR
jgi:hypothetical protein